MLRRYTRCNHNEILGTRNKIREIFRSFFGRDVCTQKRFIVSEIKQQKTADKLDEKTGTLKDGFHQWALEMGLGKPILYYEHPDGKRKADEIMSRVGLKPKVTLGDVFNGDKSLNEFLNQ
jgi:hypothetical protein